MQQTALDTEVYYRAIVAKDARFDGVFFVGVKSTGIYCRPVCPAKTPKASGCVMFRYAVEAEREGFRACFRCRPERAPGHASIDASSRLVHTAVSQIQAGYLNHHSVDALAKDLGVTSRHLRRTMKQELGVTPVAIAQSRRLAMAKQLVQETPLGMAEIAFASGFSSIGRFNAAFRKHFACTPSALRRQNKDECSADDTVTLRLDYRPPLDWESLLSHMYRRLMQGIEWVDGDAYYRTVQWHGHSGWLSVAPIPERAALQVRLSLSLLSAVVPLMARLRQTFDLDAHPLEIIEHLQQDPVLQPLVEAIPGLRLPGAFDAFAQMVRVILGQHVSVKAATTVCNRMIERLGESVSTPYPALTKTFPTPEILASCGVEALQGLGMPASRAGAVQGLAQAIVAGQLSLDGPMDRATLATHLLALRGIGPWTVDTISMRVLGDPDAFPASDLELRKALGGDTTKAIEARAEAWRPWRSYAAMYLWNRQSVETSPTIH